MSEPRDLALSPTPVDVIVGANPTQQVVLVEATVAQGLPGAEGPPGPQGPPGALPNPVAGDLNKSMFVRNPGPAWTMDFMTASDVTTALGYVPTNAAASAARDLMRRAFYGEVF